MHIRLTYDPSVDAAYLHLVPSAERSVDFTHSCDDAGDAGLAGDVMIDIGRDRKVLGIEFQNASGLLPAELLAAADDKE